MKIKQKFLILLVELIHSFPRVYMSRIKKYTFIILPGVYSPKFLNILNLPTCQFLANNLQVSNGDTVLDFGTGSGIQAIFASDRASKVLAVDINPEAIRCATLNKILNKKNNIEFFCGEFLKENSNEKFDLVIWTPPTWLGECEKNEQCSWFCGKSGETIKEFCNNIDKFMKKDGKIEVVCNFNNQLIINALEKQGFKVELVKVQKKILSNNNYSYLAQK